MFVWLVELIPLVRLGVVHPRPSGDHTIWIYGFVTGVIMVLDVLHVHGFCDFGLLVEVADIAGQVFVVRNTANVTLEVADIHRIKADQGCKQSPICFSDVVTC